VQAEAGVRNVGTCEPLPEKCWAQNEMRLPWASIG